MGGSRQSLNFSLNWTTTEDNGKYVWFNPQFGLTFEGESDTDLEEASRRFEALLVRYKDKYGSDVLKAMLDKRRISYGVSYPPDARHPEDTKRPSKAKTKELQVALPA